jgi:nitrite reductase/ring-hydroxylating ferredoxin subunit
MKSTNDEDRRQIACEKRACESGGSSRREFLQTAGCIGLAFGLLGLAPGDVAALPIAFTQGSGSDGDRRYPIPQGDSVNIDHQAQLIVVRFSGHAYVFALSCPHQNNALKWVQKESRFQCTKHDSRYQPDGVYTSGRATRNMDRYAVHRDGDSLVVDLHRWFQSDKDPKGWAAATVALA